MYIHRVKLTKKPFFELLSGQKTAEVRECWAQSGRPFQVGDTMHFDLVDETSNPTPHELSRVITHIQGVDGLDGFCIISYGLVQNTSDYGLIKTKSEEEAYGHWLDEAPPLNEVQQEVARNAWLGALRWVTKTPGVHQTYLFERAATIVRRGKQHDRGSRGIDSHLEKAAQRLQKLADFEREFYNFMNPTPSTPQPVCLIGGEDLKLLQEMNGRKGAFKMNLFLDGESAGAADSKLLYVVNAPVNHQPLPVDCEADRPVFEKKFPASSTLREGGLQSKAEGIIGQCGQNAEWLGWKACYEHHVIPMSVEIQRLKIHHRTQYLQAYPILEALERGE